MKLLDKVIAEINVNRNDVTDYDKMVSRNIALQTMRKWIDIDGMYQYAKNFGVLVDGSAEDFACEFYTAYNNEVAYTY